jgi:hypothetical protein
MKRPHPNPPAKGIWRCLLACLIMLPLPSAAAQKVVATISSPKSGGPALAGHPTWLPPDVDEKVPAVEETACSVDEIVQKAEERVLEFVRNLDRFTATESLTHQSINKHAQASTPVGRKFDYVVSIHEVRQGHLGVTEYRNGGVALNEFPGGIATNGLPALTSPSTSSLRGNNHELQSLPTAPVAVNELLLAGTGPVK